MPRPNRGAKLEANDRGVYEIRWTEQGRSKRVSTRETDLEAAAAFLKTWKAEVAAEQDRTISGTVRGVLDAYFTEHVHQKVIATGTAETARAHLMAHFADMAPSEIRKADVRAYVRKRAAGEIGRVAQNSTARRELAVLVAAMNHAVAEGRMRRGEVPVIALPEAPPPKERWLSDDEMGALFEWAAYGRREGRLSRVEVFLHLAYYTGRRRNAIERLTWDRVDFTLGRIDFDEPGRRRTKKRRGVAHMHPKLRVVLERAAREAGEEAVFVLGHAGSVRKAFETLCARAGVADVTPHTLKHTCATHMLRRGVSVWDVAGALETSPATIQKVYGKHIPEAAKQAVEALL